MRDRRTTLAQLVRRGRRALAAPLQAARYAWYAPRRSKQLTVRTLEHHGLRLAVLVNEDVGFRLLYERDYEPHETRALLDHVRPDDTCVDVGANVGVLSTLLACAAPRGRVHAFEPLDVHRALVTLNASLNGLDNVEVSALALADKPGERTFAVASDGAFSSFEDTGRKTLAEQRLLRVSTLDERFPPPATVDVLKLDVEGAEGLVLDGGRELLADPDRRPRAILVELSESNLAAYHTTPERIVAHLADVGYHALALLRDGRQVPWPARGASENVLFVTDDARR